MISVLAQPSNLSCHRKVVRSDCEVCNTRLCWPVSAPALFLLSFSSLFSSCTCMGANVRTGPNVSCHHPDSKKHPTSLTLTEPYVLLQMLNSCMVSQFSTKLTLDVDVDDIHIGYPGIPPGGPDRVQAAVRGVRHHLVSLLESERNVTGFVVEFQAVEIRAAPQGVKAKWVRIELRKVETLPGGGSGNTFYDFVGPSPVNLWTSSDEYSMLQTVCLSCQAGW
jgi:hypothetical protein